MNAKHSGSIGQKRVFTGLLLCLSLGTFERNDTGRRPRRRSGSRQRTVARNANSPA